MAYFIGQNARVCITIQNEVAATGSTFDGTVTEDNYTCVKIKAGGFSYNIRNSKSLVDELDVDLSDYVTGGKYFTWSLELPLSYSNREKFFRLWAGGSISTSEAPAPYTHTQSLADKVLFGALRLEYTEQGAQEDEVIFETFTNVAVSAISISQSVGKSADMTVSGIATARARTTTNASLTTVQSTEAVKWTELTATLNGASTYRLGSVKGDLDASLVEGEFDLATTTPTVLPFIGRSGHRGVKWNFNIRMDDSAHSLMGDPTTEFTGTNSLVWNNGEADGDEREISITFGDSYIDSVSRNPTSWGRESCSINMVSLDKSPALIQLTTTNSLDSI